MTDTAYRIAVIRRNELLGEAADRRVVREPAASMGRSPSLATPRRGHRLLRFHRPDRTSRIPPRLTARGH